MKQKARSAFLIGVLLILGITQLNSNPILAMTPNYTEGNVIEISGRISVKGPEPNTYLAITTPDKTVFRLIGPQAETLRQNYQYETVSIRGTIESEAKGPGFPTVIAVEEFEKK